MKNFIAVVAAISSVLWSVAAEQSMSFDIPNPEARSELNNLFGKNERYVRAQLFDANHSYIVVDGWDKFTVIDRFSGSYVGTVDVGEEGFWISSFCLTGDNQIIGSLLRFVGGGLEPTTIVVDLNLAGKNHVGELVYHKAQAFTHRKRKGMQGILLQGLVSLPNGRLVALYSTPRANTKPDDGGPLLQLEAHLELYVVSMHGDAESGYFLERVGDPVYEEIIGWDSPLNQNMEFFAVSLSETETSFAWAFAIEQRVRVYNERIVHRIVGKKDAPLVQFKDLNLRGFVQAPNLTVRGERAADYGHIVGLYKDGPDLSLLYKQSLASRQVLRAEVGKKYLFVRQSGKTSDGSSIYACSFDGNHYYYHYDEAAQQHHFIVE